MMLYSLASTADSDVFIPKKSSDFKSMNFELCNVCKNKIPPGKGFRQKSTDGCTWNLQLLKIKQILL